MIMLSMILWINEGLLICLEYPNKHSSLHQSLDYIIYGITLIWIILQ